MAYDPATGQLLLFGGAVSGGSYLKDTWDWTGTTWSQFKLKTNPPAAFEASMAYDSSTDQLLLVEDDCTTITTWAWSGGAWFCASATAALPATQAHSQATVIAEIFILYLQCNKGRTQNPA